MRRGGSLLLSSVVMLIGCSRGNNYLGFDSVEQVPVTSSPSQAEPPDGGVPDAGMFGSGGSGEGGVAAQGGNPPLAGAGGKGGGTSGTPNAGAASGAGGGEGGVGGMAGGGGTAGAPSVAPDSTNHLVDVVGVTEGEVRDRIEAAFQQLFHGNPETESVYVEVGNDQAYILDRLHDDTRIDALGYGMLITAQLDKKTEFDSIWNYTKTHVQYTEGPNAGYFHAICAKSGGSCFDNVGVFGSFYVVTSLLFAEERWGNGSGIYDYGAEARAILDTFRNKEQDAEAVAAGVTNVFSDANPLPARNPTTASAEQVSSGSLMPGFFQYWGVKTGDAFWSVAATRSREQLNLVINPDNGLAPEASNQQGEPLEGDQDFRESSYAVAFHLAIDTAWYGVDPQQIENANRLIRFFASFGGSYPARFAYDGTPLGDSPSGALVALNGAGASIATTPEREEFIRVVWETDIQTGLFRFYDGINQLMALMTLAGEIHPW